MALSRVVGWRSALTFILTKFRNGLLRWRLRARPVECAFSYIHANNAWGDAETVSGHGSTWARSAGARKALLEVLATRPVRSLLDVPCGDMNWMEGVSLGDVRYVGVDIVRAIVKANRRRFRGSGHRFVHLDLTKTVPPQVDLLLCRDLMVHLSLAHAVAAVQNVARSSPGWFLATTYPSTQHNSDIVTGGWRPVNLELPPFSLPAADESFADGPPEVDDQDFGKRLALWRGESLATWLEQRQRPRSPDAPEDSS